MNSNRKALQDKYEHHRDEREAIMADLDLKHGLFMNALDNFNGKGKEDVPMRALKRFPFMEWVDLNDKVRIRKRGWIYGSILVFDTVMDRGGEFSMHLHSDCDEIVDVVSGELMDLQTNTTYREGDIAHHPRKEKHIPVAIQDTVLRVYFKQ